MALADPINTTCRKIPCWMVYAVGIIPALLLVAGIFTGSLGIDPIKTLEHKTGELALQFFIASLAVTPLGRFLGVRLLKFRRAIGLLAFVYVALHLIVWVGLDMALLWEQMWRDVWKRPYITVGMGAFLLMLPLAISSNNTSVKRMGAKGWQKLHKLAYPGAVLAVIHNVMVQKVWEVEAMIYAGIVVFLIGLRYVPKSSSRGSAARAS
ncbi:MAG: protein-methionine-sulfoxide reductase heme-binding subunit MsrQ [Litoreibacter sp.]